MSTNKNVKQVTHKMSNDMKMDLQRHQIDDALRCR